MKSCLLRVFALLVLMSAVVSTIGSVGMSRTRAHLTRYIDQSLRAELSIKDCRIHANLLGGILREALVADSDQARQEMGGYLDINLGIISDEIEKFKASSEQAPAIIADYEAAFHALESSSKEVISKAGSSPEQAAKALETQVNPALYQMEQAAGVVEEALETSGAGQEAAAQRVITFFIIISALVFLAQLVLSARFSLRTTRNIAHSVDAIRGAFWSCPGAISRPRWTTRPTTNSAS